MEWVVTTGKTVDEAKDLALDQLGVAADEAEFEVLDEVRTGLFGRVKSEAKVRARVKPAQVRPKQERRRRSKEQRNDSDGSPPAGGEGGGKGRPSDSPRRKNGSGAASPSSNGNADRQRSKRPRQDKEHVGMEANDENDVTPEQVGEAAVAFMDGLVAAFGESATTELEIVEGELDVRVVGDGLGFLVGPGGRTLAAVQDLARVASQRRLGDHDTRLRIDVGGYREKRRTALERFALAVANEVREQGHAKALEPMSSSDRKAVHDAIAGIDGVTSRSEGDDPNRRVVISPA